MTLAAALPTSLTEAGMTSSGEAALFWVLAPLMVIGALGLLLSRRTVHVAVSIAGVMVGLAVFFIAQQAPFLGFVQVVVYTGAIMILFLFVLMLVGVDSSDSLVETLSGQRWIGVLAGIGIGVVLVGIVTRASFPTAVGLDAANADTNPVGVSRLLFGNFVLALEVIGALLVTAALGALILTHRRRLTPRVGQREMAEAKVIAGGRLTPLPAPGVYARHNAMDVPALDPYGQPIEDSVSRILRIRGQEADAAQFALQPGAEETAVPEDQHLTTTEDLDEQEGGAPR